MASRDLVTRVVGQDAGFDRTMKSASASARVFERELKRQEDAQRRVHDQMTQLGRGFLVAGAAVAAGLGLAAKAAIDWESAWAGVVKTVEGTPEQMAALEAELRNLATTLPSTHDEIAAVAEAAGQLGIKREDIADFTKTMIDLGVSTNLSAEEAATGIARLANIMGVSTEEVDNLGSALVALGNAGASTEAEILQMSLRIAGAGRIIGLTTADVLGIANALSSVGIDAEAGGSAISRVFITMQQAVNAGGEELEAFARVAGVSTDEFSRAFRVDAAGALQIFLAGLDRTQRTGGDTFAVLDQLGLSEIRVRDATLRLSSAHDLLSGSLELGAQSWRENTALTEEANRRYQTTESRLKIARNQVNDFAIGLGQTLLPVIGQVADTLGTLVDFVDSLPGPVKQALTAVAGFTAVVALLGGAALVATPKIAAFQTSIATLRASSGGLASALGRGASVLAGPWGLAVAGAVTALGFFIKSKADAKRRTDELIATLDEETAAITDNTRVWVANELQTSGSLDTAERLGFNLATITDAALGQPEALKRITDELARMNVTSEQVNAGLNQRQHSWTQEQFAAAQLLAEILGLNGELDTAQSKQRQLTDAQGEATGAAQELTPQTEQLAEAFGFSADEASMAADAISQLDDELKALFDQLFSVEEAQDQLTEAIQRGTEKAKERALTDLEVRETGRQLVDQAFEIINAYAAQGATEEELNEVTKTLKRRLYDAMIQMGFSKDEAKRYSSALDDVPSRVATTIALSGMTAAQRAVAEFERKLDRLPRHVSVRFTATGAIYGSGLTEFAEGGYVGRYPHGGRIPLGMGGPRQDNLIASVSSGEFVVNAAATARNLPLLAAINSGRPVMSAAPTVINNFHFPHYVGSRQELLEAIRREVGGRGGNVQTVLGR